MKHILFFFLFVGALQSYGQEHMLHSLTTSDWKLVNTDSYPYSSKGYDFKYQLSKDSVFTVENCYIHFYYKLVQLNTDSLVLQEMVQQALGETLIFERAECNEAHNQFNNPKYLSFKPLKYHLLVSDSTDAKPRILNQEFMEVALTEKSTLELYNFIFGNRFASTHQNFLIIESVRGTFGVVSDSEEICIAPNYTSVTFDRAKSSLPSNGKRSTFFTCTIAQGIEFERECN